MDTIGQRVRAVREERGLSQKDLATQVGVTQQLVGQIETGKNQGTKHIVKVARVLDVSAHWLETGLGPREPIRADGLSEREQRLLERFRSFDPKGQDLVEGMLDRLSPGSDDEAPQPLR